MKRTIAWTAGAAALALCLAAAPTSRAYASRHYHPAQAITIVEPAATVAAGSRVYHVTDDPSYDLSGTGHTLFLVDDGTAYRAPAGKTVAFVRAGAIPTEVVSIPASYRQDWMAVAAGDRPVRCLTPIRSTAVESSTMTMAPASYSDREYRAPRPARYSATHRRPYRKNHKRLSFASYRPARTTAYAASAPEMEYATTASYAVDEGVIGHELYQLGNSWYMQDGEVWCRAASWRGPYVQVKKGMVPREVRECAKAREDMDVSMGIED
jgi:hypothetical protein